MSDMMDEGDIPDILLSQLAEMKECEAKAPDIFHMDLLYPVCTDLIILIEITKSKYNFKK
jgi:hypothetical protein